MHLDTTVLQSRTCIKIMKCLEKVVKHYKEDSLPSELYDQLVIIREEREKAFKKNKQGSKLYHTEDEP